MERRETEKGDEAVDGARVILASGSRARREMLAASGLAFDIRPADLDEGEVKRRLSGQPVAEMALALAVAKAENVSAMWPGRLVLGADSMLETEDGRWFDKAADRDELRGQLRQLRGRAHRLVTAAALVRDGAVRHTDVRSATLYMRPFSDAWLEAYLAAGGEALLAAVGGYHVEGRGAQLFERIEGDQFVVRGLPLLTVLQWLREEGVLLS